MYYAVNITRFLVLPMGAPVHPGLTDELRINFPNFKDLLINYGSTEMFLVAETTTPGELGTLYEGVSVKILKQDSMELADPHEVGEVLTKTPYLMKGYLDKEKDKAVWTKDGYFHSGDLGYYKEDGVLVFKSRLKELIKYQGNHLYPMELENIIQKHPGVAEVAVLGLPHPEVQELVAALVVKADGGDNVTSEEVVELVKRSGVEDYKFIRGGVKFVKSIPKNATGKIMRLELPELFEKS